MFFVCVGGGVVGERRSNHDEVAKNLTRGSCQGMADLFRSQPVPTVYQLLEVILYPLIP